MVVFYWVYLGIVIGLISAIVILILLSDEQK